MAVNEERLDDILAYDKIVASPKFAAFKFARSPEDQNREFHNLNIKGKRLHPSLDKIYF